MRLWNSKKKNAFQNKIRINPLLVFKRYTCPVALKTGRKVVKWENQTKDRALQVHRTLWINQRRQAALAVDMGAKQTFNVDPRILSGCGQFMHMDITRWSILKPDWLYSLQLKMAKLHTVSKSKTRSWLWLRSWTPCCQIQVQIEESRGNH